ncbi:hypothetical protein C2857_005077 [Epichloe festucae Fl1]|uniref:R3H domain-containing protein n=1 Tax=Epichloe festucae (strain Fl1) TaxID=877507 RepID=A0A7S9KSK5_EPIFF|nr:hypothetical protein C2857_005077 [Epichloe festucae Fl1]
MPDPEVSQARTESQRQNRGRNHGHRRGRRGGNRPQVNGSRPGADSASSQSDAPRTQPGSVATQTPPQAHVSDSPRTESSNPGSRGRGRNRPSRGQRQSERGELASRDAPRPQAHRAFGGHLTSAVAGNDSDYGSSIVAPSLSGDAPEFVPGQPVVPRKKSSRPRVPTQPKAKPEKSMADDLGTRIHEDVANLNYECAICTDDVSRTSHIWSCTLCWTVVHLKCVKRWYGNQKKQQDLQSAEPQMEFTWRCPGCNSKLSDDPGSYHSCNESSACTAKAVVSCPCGARHQEVKCLASSSNPTPSRPELKCDDECLRLERNRRLAAALNIDPASHQNDHVPYSDATLKLFKENTSWAESQEREFRVFAKSPNEVRLRYKPMTSTYRQLLHLLAEDYGLESRSEDIEPYRYVVVFKGARFVSAPSKTLAQCVKIRATQAAEAASASAAASRASSPPPLPQADHFNGFLLIKPRFGLTIDEVTSTLQSDLTIQRSIQFETSFLPSEEILLRAITSYSAFLSPTALEQALISMKNRLAKTIEATGLAGKLLLCHVDSSTTQISRRDEFSKTDASGWSAVAGRAAAKLDYAPPVEELARETGRRFIGLRKKKVEQREKSWTERLDGDVEC